MSSTNNTLPNTGSTYPATKSQAITFSSGNPFGSSENQQNAHIHNPAEDPSARRASGIPAHPTNHSTTSQPLNSHHRPSLSVDSNDGVEGLAGDTTIRRASLAQNAPGKLGDRGENILGAVGFGGSSVERPKEDQGIGEKIAEFLGT